MRKETEKFRDERLTIKQIGSVTLVGVDTSSYPVHHGNCFDVVCDDGKNYRISNFSYENYSEVTQRFELSDVKVSIIGKRNAIIADERIPTEWYDQRWCSICTPSNLLPPQQQLEDKLSELKGDTTYIDAGDFTIVSQTITAREDSKLDPEWTIEFEEGIDVIDEKGDSELVSILSEQILKDMEEEGLIAPESYPLTEEQLQACMDGFVYSPYIPIAENKVVGKEDDEK